MKKVKIALLGIGRIGKVHFGNINQHFSNAEIVAVSDPFYNDVAFKNEHGNIFFSKNPEDAISFSGVQAVLICTPTTSHASLIEMALSKGNGSFS